MRNLHKTVICAAIQGYCIHDSSIGQILESAAQADCGARVDQFLYEVTTQSTLAIASIDRYPAEGNTSFANISLAHLWNIDDRDA
jgi:hypothetical protein